MTSSPYNPGIPTGAQTLGETHLPILTNFAELNTQFSVDHVALTAATNRGNHTKISLSQVTVDPLAAVVASPKCMLYSKTVGGFSELFLSNANAGATVQNIRQVTGLNGTAAANGRMVLPNGIIVAWGFANLAGSGAAVAFLAPFTNVFQATFTCDGATARSTSISNLAAGGFNANYSPAGACLIHYIAIGN